MIQHVSARRPRLLVVTFALAALSACGGDTAPPAPSAVAAIAGTTPQTATAGAAVRNAPGVRVTDVSGNPVANVAVIFSVVSGGGTVDGGSATTNASGEARVTAWRLGTKTGDNVLQAVVQGLPAVSFSATGVAGAPATATKTNGDPQNAVVGALASPAPSITVKDANGNAVTNLPIAFSVTSGGGTVASGTASTNAAGVATINWTFGTTVGSNALTATVPGLGPVLFSATTSAGPAASLTVTPLTANIGVQQTVQFNAVVKDQFGNLLPAAQITYTSSAPDVANITSTGKLTGLTLGTATVTIRAGSVSRTINVLVATHPVGTLSSQITALPGRPFGVRVSSTSIVAVTQLDASTISLSDLATTRTVPTGATPRDVAFTRDGTTAYVVTETGGTVDVIDVIAGAKIRSIAIGQNASRVALSPDERLLYITFLDGRLVGLNIQAGSAASLPLSGAVQGLTVDQAGEVFFASSTNGTVWRFPINTAVGAASTTIGGTPQDIALLPDGLTLAVANQDGWVDILDAATLGSRGKILISGNPFGLAVSPDGAQVYVTSPVNGTVVVIDVATRAIAQTITVGGVPRRVAFDRFGSFAAVSNENGVVDIIR